MFKRRPPKSTEITLSGIPIEIVRKDVKNINMRVYPSKRKVKISAPWYLRTEVIQNFAESRVDWIQKHFQKFKPQADSTRLEYLSGEKHPYQGKEYELRVHKFNGVPKIKLLLEDEVIVMKVRPGTTKAKREKVLKEWYRARLKEQIPKLIDKWEGPMGVVVSEYGVKQMKTRWGSCNIRAKRIWLNLELAKKSPACLESVVIHEMVHLLERLHNKRFYRLMDKFLPDWRD
jgi:predicted metal-dependent hydrolase